MRAPRLLLLAAEDVSAQVRPLLRILELGQQRPGGTRFELDDRVALSRPHWLRDLAHLQRVGRVFEGRVHLVEAENPQQAAVFGQPGIGKHFPRQRLERLAGLEPGVECLGMLAGAGIEMAGLELRVSAHEHRLHLVLAHRERVEENAMGVGFEEQLAADLLLPESISRLLLDAALTRLVDQQLGGDEVAHEGPA